MVKYISMAEVKPGVYDIEFGVYDIEFAVEEPQSVDSIPFTQPGIVAPTHSPADGTTVEQEFVEVYEPSIELEPDLNETEQTLVSFLRTQQRGRMHIGKLVRGCFGTDRLPKGQFAQLRSTLDDLKLKGYVIHEADGDYYAAPDEPLNLCRCFHVRTCSDVDGTNPDKALKVATCFVDKLVERAVVVIDDKVVGFKASELAKDYAAQMRIPEKTAKGLVQDLRNEQLLFISNRHKGSLLVTTEASAAIPEPDPLETDASEQTAVNEWTDEIIVAGSLLLDALAEADHLQRGSTANRLWQATVEFVPISERQTKHILRLFEQRGIVRLGGVEEGQRKDANRKSIKVTFADAETRVRWKNEREAVIRELRTVAAETANPQGNEID